MWPGTILVFETISNPTPWLRFRARGHARSLYCRDHSRSEGHARPYLGSIPARPRLVPRLGPAGGPGHALARAGYRSRVYRRAVPPRGTETAGRRWLLPDGSIHRHRAVRRWRRINRKRPPDRKKRASDFVLRAR